MYEQDIMIDHLVDSLSGGVAVYKISEEKIETISYSRGVLKLGGHLMSEYSELINSDIVTTLVYEPDQVNLRKSIMEAVSRRSKISVTFRIVHKNGNLVWVQLSAVLIREEDGCPVYYAILAKPFKESSMYQDIVEDSNTGVFIAEKDERKILYVNDAWRTLESIDKDEQIIGCGLFNIAPHGRHMLTDYEIDSLSIDHYSDFYKISKAGRHIHLAAKAINWNGRDAYICYLTDETRMYDKSQMLKAALNSAKVMVWRYDILNHRISDAGSLGEAYNIERIIENTSESLIKSGVVHPDSVSDIKEIFADAERGKTAQRDIYIKNPKNNEYVWKRIIYTPVRNSMGVAFEAIGTAIDISEQKNNERMYEEQVKVKKVLTSNVLAMGLFNLTENAVTQVESEDTRIIEIMCERTVDDVFKKIRQVVLNDAERFRFTPIFDRKELIRRYYNGEHHIVVRHHFIDRRYWVESGMDLINNPYTGDIEAIYVIRDINAAAQAEQVIKKLIQVDYESIMLIDAVTGDAMPFREGQNFGVLEEQRKLGDNNKGVESYLRKHCINSDIDRVVLETSLDYVNKKLKSVLIHTTTYSLKVEGKIMHKRVSYSYLDDAQRIILCAAQDLTNNYIQEEKRRQELEAALQSAKEASKAKTDFLSNMSHDMRTPMNGILGLAKLMKDKTDMEEIRNDLDQINVSGRYLLSLINDTLDMNKIESGKLTLHMGQTSREEILTNVVTNARLIAVDAKVNFVTGKSYDEYKKHMVIMTDSSRMEQILMNIISNAIKYTPEGGTVELDMENVSSENNVIVDRYTITDNGIGMSEEFVTQMFEPFTQEGRIKTERHNGTGLGMAIVKRLVDMLDGKIEVVSTMGEGTKVILELKYELVKQDDISSEISECDFSVLEGKRVLLCEDNHLNSQIASMMLENKKINVTVAENGLIGKHIFEESDYKYFDAILMDIRMPVMNGLEATKAIRELKREDAKTIPIIAMTANAFDSDVQNCIDVGMNAHLAKPIEPDLVYRKLVEYLI